MLLPWPPPGRAGKPSPTPPPCSAGKNRWKWMVGLNNTNRRNYQIWDGLSWATEVLQGKERRAAEAGGWMESLWCDSVRGQAPLLPSRLCSALLLPSLPSPHPSTCKVFTCYACIKPQEGGSADLEGKFRGCTLKSLLSEEVGYRGLSSQSTTGNWRTWLDDLENLSQPQCLFWDYLTLL